MNIDIKIAITAGIVVALNIPFWLFLIRQLFGGWKGFWEAFNGISYMQSIFSAINGKSQFPRERILKMCAFAFIFGMSFMIPFSLIVFLILRSGQ